MKINSIKTLWHKPQPKVTISTDLQPRMYNDIYSCKSTLENAIKNTPYYINFFPKNNKEAYMEMGNTQYIMKSDYKKSGDLIKQIYTNADEYLKR